MAAPGRPRLLDLFCGAGGAAMGYSRAGFDVVGVDIKPQPHYPFPMIEGDALAVLAQVVELGYLPHYGAIDAIHASPPCQAYSVTRNLKHTTVHPELVAPTRALLLQGRWPWVMENVVGAPLINPIRLCGSSFGLRVWRHRLFEMSDPPALVPSCSHFLHPNPLDVTGTGAASQKIRLSGGGRSRKPHGVADARDAMGADWMSRAELAQAVPPAYTAWIGAGLFASLQAAA